MKQYKNNDINRFFKEFKNMPNSLSIEQVHQLLINPNAMAMRSGKIKLINLKLIIMTSAFIAGISALLILLNPGKTEMNNSSDNKINPLINNSIKPEKKTIIYSNKKDTSRLKTSQNVPSKEKLFFGGDKTEINNTDDSCSWPLDTNIDKKDLFVYLSDSELKKLGVTHREDALYYRNADYSGNGYIANSFNWRWKKRPEFTNYKFYLEYNSDTSCTSHHWGHPFYTKVDTLVPVYIKITEKEHRLFWFTPNTAFFDALPDRYSNLESIYKNLKCIKKQNPSHQIVNYWNESNNIVLDQINYLELSVKELQNIGIEIYTDSIYMEDLTNSFVYLRDKRVLNCGTVLNNDSILPPDFPDMFPTLITDIKGLKLNSFGKWIKEQNNNPLDNEAFNTLIPVLFPLSEIITGNDHNLVFWYYPTDNFLNSLPENIGKQLKGEITYLKTGISNKEANCNYFEACKSTLQVENLKVYPNPANETISIKFSLPKESNGNISIVNISGQLVKTIVANDNFMEQNNFYQADISDLSPGMYLISINTESDFKTQRIIISR